MGARPNYTPQGLAAVVHATGGVLGAMEYGITPDDIYGDDELERMWADAYDLFRSLQPRLRAIHEKLMESI